MCLSCACGSPNDDHGDKRNITMQQLEQAAEAADTSVEEIVNNLETGFEAENTSEAGRRRN